MTDDDSILDAAIILWRILLRSMTEAMKIAFNQKLDEKNSFQLLPASALLIRPVLNEHLQNKHGSAPNLIKLGVDEETANGHKHR